LAKIVRHDAALCWSDKSLLLIGIVVKTSREKYSSSVFRKYVIVCAHPASTGGAYRDRHGRWEREAVDVGVLSALDARTKAFLTDGKGVWSWPPDAGVKPEDDNLQVTEAIKARSPGRARYKP